MKLGMVVIVLASVAPTAVGQAPAELILGTWTCEQASEDLTLRQTMTFLEGGQTRIDRLHAKSGPAMGNMELTGTAAGTWEIIQDLMQQRIAFTHVLSATMNGQSLPPDRQQELANALSSGGPDTSRIQVSASRLIIGGNDFFPDNICTR